MSAVKVETQNITIQANAIANGLIESNQYADYNEETITKITFEVIDKLKKAISAPKNGKIVFDDEDMFDEVYDYMLSKLKEVIPSAHIAHMVNDVFMQVEDHLFDEGLIEYNL